jgi:transcriptional regulator with PAS, ATPase and Fis domain
MPRPVTITGKMPRRKFLEQMKVARGRAIHAALTKAHGNVTKAAAALGVTPQYVYLILRTEFPAGALARYQRPKGRPKARG